MNKLTDIQEVWPYLGLMYKHIMDISGKFEKDSSSITGDIADNLMSVWK